jgi:hypothetical protein
MSALAGNLGAIRRVLAGLAAILPLRFSKALASGMRTFRLFLMFLRSHGFLQSSSDRAAAATYEVNDKNDDSDQQQEVDEASCNVEANA